MLDKIVEQICDENSKNDTIESYVSVIRCISDCIELINEQFTPVENDIIAQAVDIWGGEYSKEKIDFLHSSFPGRYNAKENTKQRNAALQLVKGSILMSFEKWFPDEYERPHLLEYSIFYLRDLGVNDSQLHSIIKKHFFR